MRDPRFVAQHRGGELSLEQHRQLMGWAIVCVEHILPLLQGCSDDVTETASLLATLEQTLAVARAWQAGETRTGAAIQASRALHAQARTLDNPVAVALTRAVAHTVATAHMADHCLGAPLYALKALKLAGQALESERDWQEEQVQSLPLDLQERVRETLNLKAKRFHVA